MSAAVTRLLSSLFPCLLFISSANFFFFGLKSLQETSNLIKFTLLIFVCISYFVLLDVLIRPFWVEVLFCKTVSFAKKEMSLNVAVTFLLRLETGYPPRK